MKNFNKALVVLAASSFAMASFAATKDVTLTLYGNKLMTAPTTLVATQQVKGAIAQKGEGKMVYSKATNTYYKIYSLKIDTDAHKVGFYYFYDPAAKPGNTTGGFANLPYTTLVSNGKSTLSLDIPSSCGSPAEICAAFQGMKISY